MPYNDETDTFEMNALEKKFDAAMEEARPLIEAKMEAAMALIEEAEKLAEQHGVPFDAHVLGIHHTFVPKSFNKKFGKIEEFDHWDICIPENYPGWYNSYQY